MENDRLLSKLHVQLLRGRKQRYTRGQVFQYSNDRQELSLITEGFVKRYSITTRGNLGVQSIYGKGDIFPLTHMYKLLLNQDIYRGQEVYYYEAMAKSEVYSIDNQTLLAATKNDPTLYKELLVVAGERLESNIQQLENLSLHNAYNRVAHLLYFLALRFGIKVDKGVSLPVPLTQQDLADILGASRETISMAVAKLRDQKLLMPKRGLCITNMEKLKEEAYK